MTLARRFLVVLALMFWQGGFMFYGAVTVPVTREVLRGRAEPSQITEQVTQWMNLIGTVAILVKFLDCWSSPLLRRWWRWAGWLILAAPQPVIVWMHREMSGQMSAPGFHGSNMHSFHHWHQVYLLLNTLQWLGGMIFLIQSIKSWRMEDMAPSKSAIVQSDTASAS